VTKEQGEGIVEWVKQGAQGRSPCVKDPLSNYVKRVQTDDPFERGTAQRAGRRA